MACHKHHRSPERITEIPRSHKHIRDDRRNLVKDYYSHTNRQADKHFESIGKRIKI